MSEQGEPKRPPERSKDRFAWLPVAILIGAILVLIMIAGLAGMH
jgi:hypothetical protein